MPRKSKSKKKPNTVIVSRYIVAALLFGLLASLGLAVFYRLKYVATTNETMSYPLKTWTAGEIINNDKLLFSLNGVRSDQQSIPDFWELPANNQFVMVNVSFKNLGTTDYQLSPINSMWIEDENKNIYEVTSAVSIKDSIGGPVAPGQTVRGEVGFTLPTSLKNASFAFNPSIPDAHLIRIKLEIE